jgi:hypothetical protein
MIDRKTLRCKLTYHTDVDDKKATFDFATDGYYFSSRKNARMVTYRALVNLDNFIYYSPAEKGLVKACAWLSYVWGIISLLVFVYLFRGNSLVKIWNFYIYL